MKQSEITKHAALQGVPNSTIDKDWVLGHFIVGIFRQQWAMESALFSFSNKLFTNNI